MLKLGDSGEWVTYLQFKLGVPLSSTFDDTTDAAVRALQAERGLAVDGKVGPATWAALGVLTEGPSLPSPGPSPGPKPTPGPAPAPQPSPGNVFGLSDQIPAREAQILTMVSNGQTDHEWVPLTWTKNGHEVSILVSRRPLAITDGTHRLIVSTSFTTAQKIADLLGAVMLTTLVSDEMHKQADLVITPVPSRTITSTTAVMIDQSAKLDQAVANAGGAQGIVSNEGKDWILTRRYWESLGVPGWNLPEGGLGSKHNGANFGWYPGGSKSPGGLSVVQSVGLAHDKHHVDYSQLLRFMHPDSLLVDHVSRNLGQVLADPALSSLLQDEGGILPGTRHPDL